MLQKTAREAELQHAISKIPRVLATLYTGAFAALPPLAEARVGFLTGVCTVRPLLSSDNANSYGSYRRANSLAMNEVVGDASLLGGELALPVPGWPASAAL